jgi:hypothetical protein
VPHECEGTTTSGRLARNLTEPQKPLSSLSMAE